MDLLVPIGLLGLIGLLILLIIYILKPNYQQKFVSSTSSRIAASKAVVSLYCL